MKRDLQERGRDLDGILIQYLTTVKPAFDTFVQPVSHNSTTKTTTTTKKS